MELAGPQIGLVEKNALDYLVVKGSLSRMKQDLRGKGRMFPDLAHLSKEEYAAECYKRRRAAGELRQTKEQLRRYRYGLTKEQYAEMFERQGGLCASCRTDPADHIDHCHATKKVRGLLCAGCNKGLGLFKDDPDRVEAAAKYLRSFCT